MSKTTMREGLPASSRRLGAVLGKRILGRREQLQAIVRKRQALEGEIAEDAFGFGALGQVSLGNLESAHGLAGKVGFIDGRLAVGVALARPEEPLAGRIEPDRLRISAAFRERLAGFAEQRMGRHDIEAGELVLGENELQSIEPRRRPLRAVVGDGVEQIVGFIVVEAGNAAELDAVDLEAGRQHDLPDELGRRRHRILGGDGAGADGSGEERKKREMGTHEGASREWEED
jgi:hypothetical protein